MPLKRGGKSGKYGEIARAVEKLPTPEVWTEAEYAEIAKESRSLSKDSAFSEQQLKFLECYIETLSSQNPTSMSAAIALAGYKSVSVSSRSTIGKLILTKFETCTEHPEIMRKMGFGEVWIISKLAHLAEHARGESVRLQALNTLSKCIGMQRDFPDFGGGTEINIYPTEKLTAPKAAPVACEIEIVTPKD